jgi:hypothetical protein
MKFDNFRMVRRSKDVWFGFRSPAWEPTLTIELKNVPVRAWDPETKTWWFPMRWYHIVRSLAEPYFKGEYWPSVEEMEGQDSHAQNFIRSMASVAGYNAALSKETPDEYLGRWIHERKSERMITKTSTGTQVGGF